MKIKDVVYGNVKLQSKHVVMPVCEMKLKHSPCGVFTVFSQDSIASAWKGFSGNSKQRRAKRRELIFDGYFVAPRYFS